jgi:hypothetical protein
MSKTDSKPDSDSKAKVAAIFRELVGDRATSLCEGLCISGVADTIAAALRQETDIPAERAEDIGFHLSDWHSDAAFIVALHLFPERFTSAEIADGVEGFLIHARNHIAAAAALADHPVDDIFEVGALRGPSDED